MYDVLMFPNPRHSPLLTDDLRIDSANSSCGLNRTGWKLDNATNSSLTIFAGALQSNHTYSFIVHMESRHNAFRQATGFTLVTVRDTSPPMIFIRFSSSLFARSRNHRILDRCVIWTLCEHNLQFQYVNPTTQIALASECVGNCTALHNITWNIYHGTLTVSSNHTTWTLFNQTTAYENVWFFGKSNRVTR